MLDNSTVKLYDDQKKFIQNNYNAKMIIENQKNIIKNIALKI